MTRARRAALAPVVLLALAVLAGACGGDDEQGSGTAGQVVGTDVVVGGVQGSVQLPAGLLELSVAAPSSDGTDELDAPDGGSVVALGFSFDQGAAPLGGELAFPAAPTTVSLRACGEDVPLGQAYVVGEGGSTIGATDPSAFLVALSCDPDPAQVRAVVTYEGVEQVVDAGTGEVDAGRAAGLADLTSGPPPTCDTASWSVTSLPKGVPATVDCALRAAYRTPYVPGIGWAAEGRAWAVLDVSEIRLLEVGAGPGASYEVVSIQDASTMSGAAAVQPLTQQSAPREYVAGGHWVFDVAAGSDGAVDIDLDYGLRAVDRSEVTEPETASVQVTGTIDLPGTS